MMSEREARISVASENILRAAVSGLLGLSAAACAEDAVTEEDDPNSPHEDHLNCGDGDGDGDAGAAGDGDGDGDTEVEKEISTDNVQLTHTELKEMCEDRGGFIQMHASCAGVNTCRGFTYGDWGEDAQLVEHTCSGVNGCNGLSCVVAEEEPEGGGLTGEEIMKLDEDYFIERAGVYSADPCKTCHVPSEHNDELDDYVYDYSKLRLLFWPGDTRNAENWTERSAKQQAAMVAFGIQGFNENGDHYANMAGYTKLFSKAEIERVVEYMRGFDPEDIVSVEIKLETGADE